MLTKQLREVRIFISSTFRDMHQERDLLGRYTFPELNRRCQDLGVEVKEVDLRWGITREQAERGEILAACLAEIDHCRPFFIGLLGDRYGTKLQDMPNAHKVAQALQDQYPQVYWQFDHSITEHEIMYAVLNNPAMATRAFFYFRHWSYRTQTPTIENTDLPDEDEQDIFKLKKLKDRIRASGVPLVDGYSNPQDAAERILEDLWQAISAEFPAGTPAPGTRKAQVLPVSMGKTSVVFVGREKYLEHLDQWVDFDRQSTPNQRGLILTGPTGIGKSSILAEWLNSRAEHLSHQDVVVASHFCEADESISSVHELISAVSEEIDDLGAVSISGGNETKLKSTMFGISHFPRWLDERARTRRILIILDGVESLPDAYNFTWIPAEIPTHIRILITAAEPDYFTALSVFGWEKLEVYPLEYAERIQIVRESLAKYSKQIEEHRLERIASASISSSPLLLHAILNELRLFGFYERIDEFLETYLQATTAEELFQQIFRRWELDYGQDRPHLVRDALTYLWAAHDRWEESNLLLVLGSSGRSLPSAFWAPLYLAIGNGIIKHGGWLSLSPVMRLATEHCYLSDETLKRQTRQMLCESLGRLVSANLKKTDTDSNLKQEYYWQLYKAEEWERLSQQLAVIQYFIDLWGFHRFDLKRYVAALMKVYPNWLLETYQPVIAEPSAYPHETVWILGLFFLEVGLLEPAFQLHTSLLDYYQQKKYPIPRRDTTTELPDAKILDTFLNECLTQPDDLDNTSIWLFDSLHGGYVETFYGELAVMGSIATLLTLQGKIEQAYQLFVQQEQMCGSRCEYFQQQALHGQAHYHYAHQDLTQALDLLKKQQEICLAKFYGSGVISSSCNQAIIFLELGEVDTARRLLAESEALSRAMRHPAGLAFTLEIQSRLHQKEGAIDLAREKHESADKLRHEISALPIPGDRLYFLSSSLYFLYTVVDMWQVITYYKERARFKQEHQRLLELLAEVEKIDLKDKPSKEKAVLIYAELAQLARVENKLPLLRETLQRQANILSSLGESEQALALCKITEDLSRQLSDLSGLAQSIGLQASIYRHMGLFEKAMPLAREYEQYSKQAEDEILLQDALGIQMDILYNQNQWEAALVLLKEQEELCHRVNYTPGLMACFWNQANIYYLQGNFDRAMYFRKEQERLSRKENDLLNLHTALGAQAMILYNLYIDSEALELARQQETIARQIEDYDGIQNSLGVQALVWMYRREYDQAMQLLKQKEEICRDINKPDLLMQTIADQALVLFQQNKLDEAMSLRKEEERYCRSKGDLYGLTISLANQGDILQAKGDFAGALALYQEEEQICRQIKSEDGLKRSLMKQADIYKAMGDIPKALSFYRQEAEICRKLSKEHDLQQSLYNIAVLLHKQANYPEALKALQEQEKICRRTEANTWLSMCLYKQGDIHVMLGELEQAMTNFSDQERVARDSGNIGDLVSALSSQGMVMYQQDRIAEAIKFYQAQEAAARDGERPDLIPAALYNQALVLAKSRKLAESLALADKSLKLARQHENLALVDKIEQLIRWLKNNGARRSR